MDRMVSVFHPIARDTVLTALDRIDHEQVSGLDLPPAFVYCVDQGEKRSWITDPVDLSRFLARHPDAQVTVCATTHMRRPPATN